MIAELSDLQSGQKKKISVGPKEILLVNVQGKFHAMESTCPHMGGDLSLGELQGTNIICPKHHAVFDVTSGKAVQNGKLLFVAAKVHDLKHYPIKIEGNQILVDLS